MPLERGWVSLLQDRLETEGYEYRVVNASVSGDTTASALTRLPRALQRHRPAVVIVELGGNDGLRGLPVSTVTGNLDSIIASSRAAGAAVLLTGIRIPPNYGLQYTEQFEAIYPSLGEAYGIPVVPFLLDGVALDPALMQADGIHPNAAAQERLLDNVWPLLAPLLAR
jgi:acyl-CoA thioesterase-1